MHHTKSSKLDIRIRPNKQTCGFSTYLYEKIELHMKPMVFHNALPYSIASDGLRLHGI